MRAAFFRSHGAPDVLEVGDLPSPALGPSDVRIAVKACALNHLDLFVRAGWPGLRLPLPHVGGTDVAGRVVEAGHDARVGVGSEVLVNPGLSFQADPATGEQVVTGEVSIVGETRWGGLATECVVPASHVIPKPPRMSWEEAAALPLASITAMQMVDRKLRVRAGSRVLVVGAGGGVGVMAVQIAKARGAWVCATTGGPEKAERVRALGADHVIDYRATPEWGRAAYAATGKAGFDGAIDSVGVATVASSLRCLRPGGVLTLCGATTGPVAPLDLRLLFWRQLSLLGSTMGVPADLEGALALWAGGKLKVIVDSTYPLDRIREAQAHLEAGRQFGKVVLHP
ncbi:MAG: zinc-binding dehydrogenase [Thermoplasmatota archaeon]